MSSKILPRKPLYTATSFLFVSPSRTIRTKETLSNCAMDQNNVVQNVHLNVRQEQGPNQRLHTNARPTETD